MNIQKHFMLCAYVCVIILERGGGEEIYIKFYN